MSESKKTILENVVDEAWGNEDFKANLIKNPVEAISTLVGKKISLPEGKTRLVVTDQSDSRTAYFNIPIQPNNDDVELTEEQLEIIAGGRAAAIFPVFGGGCIWPPRDKGCFPPFQTNSTVASNSSNQ